MQVKKNLATDGHRCGDISGQGNPTLQTVTDPISAGAAFPSLLICNTMTNVHAFLTKGLSGQRDEFFHVGLARRQQRSHDLTAGRGELIAVAAADFLDNAVGSQSGQRSCQASALSPLFERVGFSSCRWLEV